MNNIEKNIILFIILLILQTGVTVAQKNLNEGNKYYDRNLFEEAIPYYLKELEKGTYKSKIEAREQLANCYRLTGRFLEANEIYKTILDKSSRYNKSEHALNYANSLKSSALYEEAAEQFKNYIKLKPDDPMGKIYLESCSMAQEWLNEEDEFFVMNFDLVNTNESDFAPCYYAEGIAFTSSREGSKKKFINLSDNTNEIRTDLFYANLMTRTEEKISIINLDPLNSFLHEGSATFSKDGKDVYFTRTVLGEKNRKTNIVLNSLQIFHSKKINDTWTEPLSAFSFNSENYSVGQPSLSPNGKTIYFISDMPGGLGKTDIYYSELQSNGKWGPPKNIGDSINTFGYELSPYIHSEDTLFFSSDTHPGMGKLDIFYSVRTNGEWGKVKNLKTPINSIGDDFGIVLDPSQNKGFFSSDRFNGKGKEDIFTLYREEPLKLNLIGNKIHLRDYSVYNGFSYKLSKESGSESQSLVPKKGIISFELQEDSLYRLNIRKNGFFYDAISIKISRENAGESFKAELKSGNTPMLVGGILAEEKDSIIKIENYNPKQAKKGPVLSFDTISIDIPVSETEIILSENNHNINQEITDNSGRYSFSSILKSGKLYTISAIEKEESVIGTSEDLAGAEETTITAKDTIPVEETTEFLPEYDEPIAVIPVLPDSQFAELYADTTENYITEEVSMAETDTLIAPGLSLEPSKDSVYQLIKGSEPKLENIAENTKGVEEKHLSLSGEIINNSDNEQLSNVKIKVSSDNNFQLESLSDEQGSFSLSLPIKESYSLSLIKKGYFEKQILLSRNDPPFKGNPLIIPLSPIERNTTIELKNIIFDLNKSVLREESFSELNRLTDFLNENPDLKIQLNAHTDTRGNYYFNIQLSQERAEAVKSYLLAKGIDESRIITEGFGESFPINPNAKTEAEHRVNRRVEFKVLIQDMENNWNFKSGVTLQPKGFFVFNENVYSAEKPFEENTSLPEGLFYRIKIGEYSKPLNYSTFKGLFPIVKQTDTEHHTYEYYAGLFNSLEDAEIAVEIIKKNFCPDAYILAYYNNKQITIKESLEIAKNIDIKAYKDQTRTNSSFRKEVEEKHCYAVQIGAFRRALRSSVLKNFEEIVGNYDLLTLNDKNNTIYAIGRFNTYEEAFKVKKELISENELNDAFIIAVFNNEKISILEARKLESYSK